MRTAKTLIRLGGSPGRSESLLGAQAHCWFCCVVAQIIFFLCLMVPRLFSVHNIAWNFITSNCYWSFSVYAVIYSGSDIPRAPVNLCLGDIAEQSKLLFSPVLKISFATIFQCITYKSVHDCQQSISILLFSSGWLRWFRKSKTRTLVII